MMFESTSTRVRRRHSIISLADSHSTAAVTKSEIKKLFKSSESIHQATSPNNNNNANNNSNNSDEMGATKGHLNEAKAPTENERTSQGVYRFQASEEADHLPLRETKAEYIFKGFKANTTSHGLPQINNARGGVKRSFWVFITLLMVGLLVYYLYFLVRNFLGFNVNIVIEMQHKRELTFPAVTICNMNPIRNSKLYMVPELEDILANQTSSTENSAGDPVPGSIYPERVLPRDTFRMEEKVASVLADINATTQKEIGYQAHEMILDCQYSGYDCYYQEFAHYHNSVHGNCYIFNSGWLENQPVKMSFKTGRRYGLKLVLNIDQGDYLANLGEAAGVRVVIHPQDRMPFPQDEGSVVAPGILTSIGLRQLTVSHEPKPYGNCTSRSTANLTRNVFEEAYHVNYSDTACYKTCYQRYLIDECKCSDPLIPKEGQAFGDVGPIKSCNPDNITQDDCRYYVTKQFYEGLLGCPDCVLPCNDYSFEHEISTVAWPSDVAEASILEKYYDPGAGIASPTDDPDEFKRNLLKLEVYYEEFNYENIKERPAITSFQFASDIGGVLGLFVGWSVMTCFEFVELAVDLCVLACLKLRFTTKRKQPTTASQKQAESKKSQQHLQQTTSVTPRIPSERQRLPPYYNNPPLSLKYV